MVKDSGDPILKLSEIESTSTMIIVAAGPFLVVGVISLLFVVYLRSSLLSKKTGAQVNDELGGDKGHRIDYLAQKVKSGAISFLREEYKYLAVYVAFWFVVLIIMFSIKRIDETDRTDGVRSAACFLAGALLSGGSGWLGMSVATDGNVRTTVACATGTLNDGLRVAFTAGAAMGFGVTGMASVGMAGMMIAMSPERDARKSMQYLHSFGFGASSIALFARVAGGIYTKAADVGADLVGKVEAGIDEDDPHNPAVIADNVGDNVGDVAGMGADLFESYFGSIIAACTLGSSQSVARLALPLWLASAGQLSSLVGFFFVTTEEKGDGWNTDLGKLMFALEKGMYVANGIFLACGAVIIGLLFGFDSEEGWKMFGCVFIGMVTGMIIGKGTEYFTSFDFGPTKSITDRARTGPATVIIQGMGVGMISTVLPTLVLAVAIVACAELANEYGVALAAVGMLATLAISLSTDAYGPIADNAGGLAEMGNLGPAVRAKTDSLDALGNTTAAIGKGFAVGSAVLTALSLLAAFKEEVNHKANAMTGQANLDRLLVFEVDQPILLAGVLVGAMLPYLFGALTMLSVGKAAAEMIEEVRRQFREVKNAKGRTLMEAIQLATQGVELKGEDDVEPDSDRCVMISTRSSVKEMIAPGMYAVLSPLTVGLLIGPKCVMGLLAGTIGSAAMLAVMMGNAGGAWDNSKKLCEKLGIKKTEQGKACVVGDTVGDPYKDTSGPSLDILLKLMAMVALLIAPLMDGKQDWDDWYVGIVPLVLGLGGTVVLIQMEVLTWKDPLGNKIEKVAPLPEGEPGKVAAVEETPIEVLRSAGDAGQAWTDAPQVA
jgi:inorganic pyrophosphatase